MTKRSPNRKTHHKKLCERVGEKEQRKKMARRDKDLNEVWFGLGMFGVVGWSVAIPTLLLTALGLWLDTKSNGGISWTVSMLFVGVAIGSLHAWYWVRRGAHQDSGRLQQGFDDKRGKEDENSAGRK